MSNVLPERWKFACKAEWGESKRIALSAATPTRLELPPTPSLDARNAYQAPGNGECVCFCVRFEQMQTLWFSFFACQTEGSTGNAPHSHTHTHNPTVCVWVLFMLCARNLFAPHHKSQLSASAAHRPKAKEKQKKQRSRIKLQLQLQIQQECSRRSACKGQRIAFALNRSPCRDCHTPSLAPTHTHIHTHADKLLPFGSWIVCGQPRDRDWDWRWARESKSK